MHKVRLILKYIKKTRVAVFKKMPAKITVWFTGYKLHNYAKFLCCKTYIERVNKMYTPIR